MSKVEYEDVDSSRIEGNQYCIANELIDANIKGAGHLQRCGSSDAMSTYLSEHQDGTQTFTSYCFSCSQSFNKHLFAQSSYAKDFGIEGGVVTEKKTFVKKPKRKPITKEEVKTILSYGYEGKGERGIKDEYSKFFGQVTKLGKFGEPKVRFYPETRDGKLVGYKSRTFLGKKFGYENVGQTGSMNDLAGQVKFKDMQFRDICLLGGEEELPAFMQQFTEHKKKYAKEGEEYAPMPVVSPTTGETSALKQIRNNYDFINRAERIYLGFDSDEAGRAAMQEIAEIFPREKVFIITWSYGDPNGAIYNKEGKDYSAQTVRDFYNAKPYYSNGIVTSKEADSLIEEELLRPKMSLPPFMYDLQKKMAGGIPLGYIVNWIAETGIGKSTLINEAIRHWIYTSPYKIGILSLELTASQYMIAMLSREIGYKINLIESPEEAVEFVRKPEVIKAREHLSTEESGEPRFVLLDERDGDLEQVKVQCELLINKYGCRVLIIDPIQDLFEGIDMDQQNAFIKWMKGILKKGVTFNNVCHVRKGGNSTDKEGKRILRELNEDSVHGISAIVKSAGSNVFATRDKYEDCEVRKNITYPTLGKCRWTGNTGRINDWYYDNESHTMHDFLKFAEDNPTKIPSGFDFDYDPFDRGSGKSGKNKPNQEETFKMEVEEMVMPQAITLPEIE